MFGIVDTAFSNGRRLIVCSSCQEFSKTKESTLRVIENADTAFLLCGADMVDCSDPIGIIVKQEQVTEVSFSVFLCGFAILCILIKITRPITLLFRLAKIHP